MLTFEFNNQLVPQSLIDIEELGNFGMEASTEEGLYYYMIIKCFLGTAVIATCGPVIPDVEMLPSGFSMTLAKMPADENKLAKTINMFLNDKHRALTDAKIISVEDAISNFRELKDYLLNFNEDMF